MDPLGLPHHDGSELYVLNPAPASGDLVPLRVRVPRSFDVGSVHLRTVIDGEPAFVGAVLDHEAADEVWYRADLRMHSPVMGYRWLLDLGDRGYSWLNGQGVIDHDVTDFADFRLTSFEAPPAWAVNSVVYQVFPDRFASSSAHEAPDWAVPMRWDEPVLAHGRDVPRQFYGGDLPGVEAHLDHLERLGVTTLYLTPFFPAESNHRYNAATFDHVDPLLGGDAALESLASAVHRRGMRILADLTTNHSGSTHEWFVAALADAGSDEATFYYWRDHPDDYEAWLGIRSLPKFNLASGSLRERLLEGEGSVVARWLDEPFALDGWRIDVANMTGRHGADEFNNDVARTIRTTMAAVNPDTLLIAEHCHDATADLSGDGWHGTMNYAGFTRPVWSWLNDSEHGLGFLGMPVTVPTVPGENAVATMRDFMGAVPWRSSLHNFNLLGSHDTPRIRTIVGDPARQAAAAGLLFTYVGIPMVFMGDEIGLTGTNGEHARTPMPWDEPDAWADPVHAVYRDLIALRSSHRALREGGLRWVHVAADALCYLRETADERLLVLVSRAEWSGAVVPALSGFADAENVYGGSALVTGPDGPRLPGHGPGTQVWRAAPVSR
jgi:alpha-glucosidase